MALEAAVLRAALLWARNHIDLGRADLKNEVLDRLDDVIGDFNPTMKDVEMFNEFYPIKRENNDC